VRAAVAQAEQARRVVEHFTDRFVVSRHVIHHREEQELILLDDVVVALCVPKTLSQLMT
jgi:hypothetical protein